MHGHFSRLTFDELDRFSAVVALQGRVSVEADHNEHTAILQHYLRTLVTDVLGRHAWPADHAGFEVGLALDGGDVEDLTIGDGRCYVEGVLVENPAAASFYEQPDARFNNHDHKLPDKYPYFVYCQVWERLVTFIEEPAIRDAALGAGGPDSAARTKVVWQARHGDHLTGANVPATAGPALKFWRDKVEPGLLGETPGEMTASVAPGKEDELCALAPEAGYRGLENQLYRVEIHSDGVLKGAAGAPDASFKWSRDNGSVVFPVTSGAKGKVVTVANLGRDDRYSLDLGDWVECVDDASVLNREPLALRRVIHIDPIELLVTFDAAPEREFGSDPKLHPLLRRWDQQPLTHPDAAGNLVTGGAGNAIELAAGEVALEDGISISFADGNYRAGDYWVFPARVETGEVEWPTDDAGVPLPRPPDGVRRSYVPLALVTGATKGGIVDLRSKPFTP